MTGSYHTCLLIDDNYIDNFVTRRLLESSHFAEKIIVTESPTEAIKMLDNGTVKPDVIFLDIRMPLMSGFEFLDAYDKLAIAKTGIKIFLLSSSFDPTDIKRSTDNKYITHFIHKPLTYKILEELP
ncbi:response regulator [Mucilaginibacter sp. UR6-11]|uniref:response regulator n=1 Tax=Mucilaginibacter sp. UR6-11 TaxID=1435644 RepID=UPI001E5F398C|nr:response regulator [Mucilaginibacter sp. UR6-11]MCC8426569.1 response regulator [Mucilaginibacter sp. UR6-11]